MKINKYTNKNPIECSLNQLKQIKIKLVTQTDLEDLWNYLVSNYHYLGHKRIIGKRLKYLVFTDDQPIAAIGWKSAYIKFLARDEYIGWSIKQKKEYLKHVINNNRFLILNWIKIPNLASHILSQNIKQLVVDWNRIYNETPFLLETFIDPNRYKGTCYRAANWINIGKTKGYTKQGKKYTYHGLHKEAYIYVINPNFRNIIGCQRIISRRPKKSWEKEHTMMIQKIDFNPDLITWADINSDLITAMAKELQIFHNDFQDAFIRREQKILSECYLKGLLSDIERKNIELIALRYLGPQGVRSLQFFLSNCKIDDDALNLKYKKQLSNLISSADGMITLDSSEMAKKGNESVGVAPQYCNNLGKVENCQSGVFLGYTGANGYGLVDKQLYMPERWFTGEYKTRLDKCKVPDDITFKTKIEIGIDMIEQAIKENLFNAKWVGADTTFGNDSKFRNKIDSLGLYYLVNIKKNTLVWLTSPEVETYTVTDNNGNEIEKQKVSEESEKPMHVEDVVKENIINWQKVKLTEGAEGPLFAEMGCVKIIEHIDGLPQKELQLFVRKNPDGTLKYFFSNALNESLAKLGAMCIKRYPIEQCFKDGKKNLGMDHYEHRSWIAWYRHMSYVFLGMLFLLKLRLLFKKNSQH